MFVRADKGRTRLEVAMAHAVLVAVLHAVDELAKVEPRRVFIEAVVRHDTRQIAHLSGAWTRTRDVRSDTPAQTYRPSLTILSKSSPPVMSSSTMKI